MRLLLPCASLELRALIKPRIHLRNAAVVLATLVLLFLLATGSFPVAAAPLPAPLAQTNALDIVSATPVSIAPNSSATVSFRISSVDARAFTLSQSLASGAVTFSFPSGNQVSTSGTTPTDFSIQVNVPSGAVPGSVLNQTLAAVSTSPNQLNFSRSFTVLVAGNTPTPTATTTATVSPPTATPTRGPVCRDGFEPDDSAGSARVIDVNTAQERAICPAGDLDWLVFGGVAGKVYTIDISRQDPGIDLTLELFDANLNSIAFNDDFFNRDPANPNAADTRPRITIRIPADGRYYIQVRDAAGRGGVDFIYVVALISESYGPTPTLVSQLCEDLFETDGLPEQARLITSNEIQEDRRLCPAGDADWVIFFAKTGKRYIVYTDTRRYRGRTTVNGETQAGADTTIVLTERDGVTMIDANDDIPGGSTLDSQIEFIPDSDGFYFVQVKNVGDIGNQFIRYDLVLLLCVPGQTDCGRISVPGLPAVPVSPLPTGTPDDEFNLDPTATPTSTTTP